MSAVLDSQSERIRSKMALLRVHMHKDARRIVANTNRLLDWKDYVRQFPKALVVAGFVTGFVLVPGRKVVSSVKLTQESIDDLLAQQPQYQAAEVPLRSEIASGAVRLLTGLALSGLSILFQKGVENHFRSQSNSSRMENDNAIGIH